MEQSEVKKDLRVDAQLSMVIELLRKHPEFYIKNWAMANPKKPYRLMSLTHSPIVNLTEREMQFLKDNNVIQPTASVNFTLNLKQVYARK